MIRIDEIYNNTFWPWFNQHRSGTRVFFCDPPGFTDPEHLFNLGHDDIVEKDYVFFHDQEPVHLDSFGDLFNQVLLSNVDIGRFPIITRSDVVWPSEQDKNTFANWRKETPGNINIDVFFKENPKFFETIRHLNPDLLVPGHVVVSERGEFVEELERQYGWKSHYYFYHGWACQDWFRGYDKTFLIARAKDRAPTRTFMSPNRIVAGKRDHRVLFLYNVFKHGLESNHISAPRVCQYENVDITSIAQKYQHVYQDITDVFTRARLPRLFAGEDQQEMTSCWLSNFVEAEDSLVYVPTETVYFGRRQHITEKTFKAIALEMPFVLVAPAGSLEYMREYGFQTFSSVFDESYDTETDDIKRIERVAKLLKDLDNLSLTERQEIHRACLPIVEHNFNHFYNGGLTDVLWAELQGMLREF